MPLLPRWAQPISYVNPILYMVNAFRYGFLGVSDVNIRRRVRHDGRRRGGAVRCRDRADGARQRNPRVRARVALVSARAARDLDEDLPPLVTAFDAAGVPATVADWDAPEVDWAAFDLALLRSTWDYTQRFTEFLAWADRVAQLTTLLNPPARHSLEHRQALPA